MADERVEAAALANRVLDRVFGDPDDDMAVLARQLLRAREALEDVWTLLPTYPSEAMARSALALGPTTAIQDVNEVLRRVRSCVRSAQGKSGEPK